MINYIHLKAEKTYWEISGLIFKKAEAICFEKYNLINGNFLYVNMTTLNQLAVNRIIKEVIDSNPKYKKYNLHDFKYLRVENMLFDRTSTFHYMQGFPRGSGALKTYRTF